MSDRYLKAILTVIALELLWLGVKDLGTPVGAQATREPMPVVVTGTVPIVVRGIDLGNRMPNALPVFGAPNAPPVGVSASAPLPIEAPRPVPIVGSVPLRIQADRPIPVENVGYTPGQRPGE